MKEFLRSFIALALGLISFAFSLGTLTPGIGAPKPKPRRHYGRRDAPAAILNVGMIRHRATTLFKRFLEANHNQQATSWMVTT